MGGGQWVSGLVAIRPPTGPCACGFGVEVPRGHEKFVRRGGRGIFLGNLKGRYRNAFHPKARSHGPITGLRWFFNFTPNARASAVSSKSVWEKLSMAITLEMAKLTLKAKAFVERSATKKVVEWEKDGQVLYLRLGQGFPRHADVVVHPDADMSLLLVIPGVEVNKRVTFRHGSNMARFPKRRNKGKNDEHYGRALWVSSVLSLETLCDRF